MSRRWRGAGSVSASGESIDAEYRDEHDVQLGRLGVQIVGCRYYAGVIHMGEMANLVREPRNPYDANAIRVDNMAGIQVGHLKRIYAAALAPLMDDASAGAPRLELVVTREPSDIFSVDAHILITGLEEHAQALVSHLSAFGLRMVQTRPPAPSVQYAKVEVQVNPLQKSQQELDALASAQEDQLKGLARDEVAALIARCDRLTAKLLPHQVQGVAWMASRECGLSLESVAGALQSSSSGPPPKKKAKGAATKEEEEEPLPPLWERRVERGTTVYYNAATNSSSVEVPRRVAGGLLADAMGLGKTIQVLGLVAVRGGTTLIVCPTGLMNTWMSQAAEHAAGLVTTCYHGANRTSASGSLAECASSGKYDLVVTSYGTLASDHKQDAPAAVFQRVVLDESHTVRNVSTKNFVAVEAVARRAAFAWCLTGTPVINKVDDLLSVFRILRAPPVCEDAIFKRCISRPIKHGDPAGLSRLRLLVRSLCLRRNKSVLGAAQLELTEGAAAAAGTTTAATPTGPEVGGGLPPRTLETRYIDIFAQSAGNTNTQSSSRSSGRRRKAAPSSSRNKMAYDALFKTAGAAVAALGSDALSHYSSILEVITRLRQICSGGASLVAPERIQAALEAHRVLLEGARKSNKKRGADGARSEPVLSKEAAQTLLARLNEALQPRGGGSSTTTTTTRPPRHEGGSAAATSVDGEEEVCGAGALGAASSLFECVVCLNETPAQEAKCLRACQHFYCSTCTRRLVTMSGTGGGKCAMCRAPFTEADVVSVDQVTSTVRDAQAAERAAAESATGGDEEDKAPRGRQRRRAARRKEEDSSDQAEDDSEEDAPKLDAVVQTVAALPAGDKAVVFSQFVATLSKLEARLGGAGIAAATYTGKLTASRRAALVTAFQTDDEPRVLLVSLKCGAQGLTLTRAATVCLLDPWWNAATEDQALDRVHRIGQTKPVTAIKFVAAKTIEERIIDLQKAKTLVSEGSLNSLSAEQLREVRLGHIHKLFAPFDD